MNEISALTRVTGEFASLSIMLRTQQEDGYLGTKK